MDHKLKSGTTEELDGDKLPPVRSSAHSIPVSKVKGRNKGHLDSLSVIVRDEKMNSASWNFKVKHGCFFFVFFLVLICSLKN